MHSRQILIYLEWKFKLDACSVIIGIIIAAGLRVEIFIHKKVLHLNVFLWGLLLNNGEKNTEISKGVSYWAIFRNDSKIGPVILGGFIVIYFYVIS